MIRILTILAFLIASAAPLLLSGCLTPPSNPVASEEKRQKAELLAAARDFSGAADALDEAIEADPGSTANYLRRGEFLEGLGRWPEARDVYKSGMKEAKGARPPEELAWRLALLEALHLDELRRAKSLLRNLPEGGPLREDVQGVLALKGNDPRKAIGHFDIALKQQPGQDVTAAIYYHAALAYNLLGDSRNTYSSLFHAVNNAGHRGTIRDIETLWAALNTSPGSKQSTDIDSDQREH